jgi:hypothetical protein
MGIEKEPGTIESTFGVTRCDSIKRKPVTRDCQTQVGFGNGTVMNSCNLGSDCGEIVPCCDRILVKGWIEPIWILDI